MSTKPDRGHLFNSAAVPARQCDYRLTGDTGFNEIREIMSPRIARLGLRVNF